MSCGFKICKVQADERCRETRLHGGRHNYLTGRPEQAVFRGPKTVIDGAVQCRDYDDPL